MDSKIIDSNELLYKLMNLCEFKQSQNWLLLYRASDDDFDWKKFHDKCDDKTSTLVVVKSVQGSIMGGYTEALWNDPHQNLNGYGRLGRESKKYKSDPNAFLFVLKMSNIQSLKAVIQRVKEAVFCDATYGPTFGTKELKLIKYGPWYSTTYLESKIDWSRESSYKIQKDNQQSDVREDFSHVNVPVEEIEVFQKWSSEFS